MPQIGHFTRTTNGFSGRIITLHLNAELTLVPALPTATERAPDYRVHLGADAHGLEIGAGWKHSGEKAGEFISMVLDDPILPRPIRANLFRDDGDANVFHLIWSRPARRSDQA